MKKITTFIGLLAAIHCSHAFAYSAHEHGVAHMNLLVDQSVVAIEIQTPLANVISFEHAPQTPDQKQEVIEMVTRLQHAEQLFIFPDSASCKLEEVSLHSGVIDEEILSLDHISHEEVHNHTQESHANVHHDDDDHHHTHGNLDIDISFHCQDSSKLNQITINLFDTFPNLNEIEVQMITPNGQSAAQLTPQSNTIKW